MTKILLLEFCGELETLVATSRKMQLRRAVIDSPPGMLSERISCRPSYFETRTLRPLWMRSRPYLNEQLYTSKVRVEEESSHDVDHLERSEE